MTLKMWYFFLQLLAIKINGGKKHTPFLSIEEKIY